MWQESFERSLPITSEQATTLFVHGDELMIISMSKFISIYRSVCRLIVGVQKEFFLIVFIKSVSQCLWSNFIYWINFRKFLSCENKFIDKLEKKNFFHAVFYTYRSQVSAQIESQWLPKNACVHHKIFTNINSRVRPREHVRERKEFFN